MALHPQNTAIWYTIYNAK